MTVAWSVSLRVAPPSVAVILTGVSVVLDRAVMTPVAGSISTLPGLSLTNAGCGGTGAPAPMGLLNESTARAVTCIVSLIDRRLAALGVVRMYRFSC